MKVDLWSRVAPGQGRRIVGTAPYRTRTQNSEICESFVPFHRMIWLHPPSVPEALGMTTSYLARTQMCEICESFVPFDRMNWSDPLSLLRALVHSHRHLTFSLSFFDAPFLALSLPDDHQTAITRRYRSSFCPDRLLATLPANDH